MADDLSNWALSGPTKATKGVDDSASLESWAGVKKPEKKEPVSMETAAGIAKAMGVEPTKQSAFRRGVSAGSAAIPGLLGDIGTWLYEKATGGETNFGKVGTGLNEFLNIEPLSKEAPMSEKVPYYAGETLATLGRGSTAPALTTAVGAPEQGVLQAAKEAATGTGAKRVAAETAVGVGAGIAGEYNPYLGMLLGVGGGVGVGMGFSGTTIGKAGEDISAGVDDVLKQKYGISTTKGMRLLDEAYKETDPLKQEAKLSKAMNTVLGEIEGRTAGGRTNVASWRLYDEKRSRETLAAIEKMAGLHSLGRSHIDGTDMRNAIVDGFEKWSKDRIKSFTKLNQAVYSKVDGSMNFNTAPTIDALDALIASTDSSQLSGAAKAFKKQFEKIDPDTKEVIGAVDMSLETIRRKLSQLGNAAYKGEKLKDMPVGISAYDARQLQNALQQTLEIADDAGQASNVKALREANKAFKENLKSLEKEANYDIIKFFETGGTGKSPEEMVDFIMANASDRNQVTIMRSLMGKQNPELFEQTRQYMMHRYLDGMKDVDGRLDIRRLSQASSEMKKNAFFFGDDFKGLAKAQEFFDDMQVIFRTYKLEGLKEGDYGYMAAKAGAEALGATAGAKGRYLGELGVKAAVLSKFGVPTPEMVAVIANNPEIGATILKYVKGDTPLMGNDVADALNRLQSQAENLQRVNSFTGTLMRQGIAGGEQRAVEEQQRSGQMPPVPLLQQ